MKIFTVFWQTGMYDIVKSNTFFGVYESLAKINERICFIMQGDVGKKYVWNSNSNNWTKKD